MGLLILCAVIIIFLLVRRQIKINLYNASTYHKITGVSYDQMRTDKGIAGEYLLYQELEPFEQSGARFLFNLYLPKNSYSNETTEIDVVAITPHGLMVFESKNYVGWIFGDEKSSKWCQSLHLGYGETKKEFFQNPIHQNRGHIEAIKALLKESTNSIPFWNIVVFSDNCEFKKLSVTRSGVAVVKRDDLRAVVRNICASTQPIVSGDNVEKIYELLYPYSQVSDDIKQKHIQDIKKRIGVEL